MVGKNGIILLKYWLEVDMDEQTSRIEGRITDQRKRWKLSPMDLKSYSRWYDYSQARDDMFAATDSEWVPWFAARSDDKKGVRLNIIKHLLKSIPYEVPKPAKITLPKLLVAVNFRRNLAASFFRACVLLSRRPCDKPRSRVNGRLRPCAAWRTEPLTR